MRRFLVFAAATVALFGAACGGGDDNKTNASNNDDNSSTGNNSTSGIAAATLTGVCGGREAVAMGAAGASASQSGSVDYNDALRGLKAARDAAPSEIKDDFALLVEAETPFFEALARANGNYMTAAQDPAFQAAAERLSQDDVRTASENISNWFTEHCS